MRNVGNVRDARAISAAPCGRVIVQSGCQNRIGGSPWHYRGNCGGRSLGSAAVPVKGRRHRSSETHHHCRLLDAVRQANRSGFRRTRISDLPVSFSDASVVNETCRLAPAGELRPSRSRGSCAPPTQLTLLHRRSPSSLKGNEGGTAGVLRAFPISGRDFGEAHLRSARRYATLFVIE
jgi:hypothetical protein